MCTNRYSKHLTKEFFILIFGQYGNSKKKPFIDIGSAKVQNECVNLRTLLKMNV
jgi:hypothetical protein